MAKRLSERDKEKILQFFIESRTVEEIAEFFSCSKLTISRNLKKKIGDKKYKELIINNKNARKIEDKKGKKRSSEEKYKASMRNDDRDSSFKEDLNDFTEKELFPVTPFIEITPLNFEIENSPQKDFSSIPISEVEFPNIVYMIVDKKIELETKYLKEYPNWQFLAEEELERKTIEIYVDLKNAKRFCNKEQKVIKVPNSEVFKIVAPILLSRGISRIINADKLIAL